MSNMTLMTDYRATLNLPKTAFPMKADLPRREPEQLATWQRLDLYQTIRRRRASARPFLLHDGPPYANGDIHIGHALNKTLKDIIVKYKTMRGYDAPYVPGWDCHGLPIEYQLLKELGAEQHQVEREPFRRQARAYAERFVATQREQFRRLGVFGEWERPYLTMTPDYEAAIVEAFLKLRRAGYIYRGKKPVYWCARCETALAEAEVEYQDREDRSIYVSFPVVNLPDHQVVLPASVLIWTTTPWTLPANRALCFHPESRYAVVEAAGPDGKLQRLVIAESRVAALVGAQSPKVVAHLSGEALARGWFQPPFGREPVPGVTDASVNLDEGTGVIHIAPGHGHEDYLIGQRHRLETFSPVDHQGKFTTEVPPFAGQSVFAANQKIIADLKGRGLLVREEVILHSYPHCWRCEQPVIFRATEQWFLNVEHQGLRRRLLEEIGRVQWIPAYGANRIRGMIEARPDWCLSRQRYWGTPIPVLYCIQCGAALQDARVDAAILARVRQSGSDWWFQSGASLELWERLGPQPVCAQCGHARFRIGEDILDVWFDSGVSHEAVLAARGWWPADLYLEGSDQHRGWFQTSLIPAVALRERAPYRSVLTHGFVVDGEGRKMSKSAGNVLSPQEVIARHGADVLRLWVASCDYREDVRLSETILQRSVEAYRKIRNSCRFLLSNLYDFDPAADAAPEERLWPLDRWVLGRLARVVDEATDAYDAYEFHRLFRAVYDFCNEDLSACYLDAIKDRLYAEGAQSPARRAAQTALQAILQALVRLIAPVLPFTAEEIWAQLRHAGASWPSVHLADWPSVAAWRFSAEEAAAWDALLAARSTILKALETERIAGRIGDPLEAAVAVAVAEPSARAVLERYRQPLEELCVISSLRVASPDGARPSPEPLAVAVAKAPGRKCLRCWRWLPTVGVSAGHPGLCQRCVTLVEGLSEGGPATP